MQPGYTVHTKYISDPARGIRRRAVEEKWERDGAKALGRGTFGTVWFERCTSGPSAGQVRAVKQIYKNFGPMSVSTKALSGELSAIMKFSHQLYRHCFVQSFGWYDSQDYLYITMEYLPRGDLSRYLENRLPEAEASLVILQVLEGLDFMHRNKFAHRDLKPNNILVQHAGPNWWVKISDFGTTKQIETTVLRTGVGTGTSQAPEVRGLFTPADMADYSERLFPLAVDIWGVGAIAFRMATGRILFSALRDLYSYVVQGFAFPFEESLSAECNAFVSSAMHASPKQRPSATTALTHPWLKLASSISTDLHEELVTPMEELNVAVEDPTVEASAEWPTISSGADEKTESFIKVSGTSRSSTTRIGKSANVSATTWIGVGSEPPNDEKTPLDEGFKHQQKEAGSSPHATIAQQTSENQRVPRVQVLKVGDGQDGVMVSTAYSPDGEVLAICMEHAIHIYTVGEDGQFNEMGTLRNPEWQLIESMAVTDQRIVALTRNSRGDRSLEAWHKKDGHYESQHKYRLGIDDLKLDAWALSQDSTTLILGGHRRNRFYNKDEFHMRAFYLSDRNELKFLAWFELENRISWIVVSPDGGQFTQYIDNTTSMIWQRVGSNPFVRHLRHQKLPWEVINFSPDGSLLAARSQDGKFVIIRKSKLGRYAEMQQLFDQEPMVAAFSPDGRFLATILQQPEVGVVVWEKDMHRNVLFKKCMLPSQTKVSSVTFSPDARQIVTGSFHDLATIWHL
ncbi:unnamed protein product [Clonostachys chloroleuca]|uniref:mitogen-activated protein kinase n=1 Tax=Clonostachys chloroleuca TaxID=1926264 RepID=A0AA35LW52_9HYPO|nr:unnamed protein product [Clonostachys chloroleuca]